MNSYTLTGIKTFTGMEGQGLNAIIRRDGAAALGFIRHWLGRRNRFTIG